MSDEYEDAAREEGWVPLDQWRGDPDRWVDAETFDKMAQEKLPLANARVRRQGEKIDRLEKTVNELEIGNREFRKFHDEFAQRKAQETEVLRGQLEAKRQQAIDDSDGKSFTAADKQLRDLDSQQKTQAQESKDVISPDTQAWLNENEWYTNDRVRRATADGFADELAKTRPDLVGSRGFLDELGKMVKEALPEKFENPNREKSPVAGEGNKGGASGGRTFDDLPQEAQEAAMRFEKTHGLTRAQYLAEYPWE